MSEEAVKAAEATETTEVAAAEIAETTAEATAEEATAEEVINPENVSYHAVEKEGNVTAIWEMQGPKHIRTIDPRSSEGKQILALFETAG
jgi:hypothetical protein